MVKRFKKGRKIIGIIPARGGSKGLPRKNIKKLAGKPLISYTIDAALKSRYLERVIVSTEDKEISEISKSYGAEIIRRPKELALDRSPIIQSLIHVLDHLEKNEKYVPDQLVLLQPTSPIRDETDIDGAIESYLNCDCDSLISVCAVSHPPHWLLRVDDNGFLRPVSNKEALTKRRQDFDGFYLINGAIYIAPPRLLKNSSSFFTDKTLPYFMSKKKSIDIDEEIDLDIANFLVSSFSKKKKIKIANRYIGIDEPCFIIAEAGINHNGDIDLAYRLIDSAKDAGVDAIKFQTYKAENLVTAEGKIAKYQQKNIGVYKSQLDMLKEYELSYEDFISLKEYCDEKGIIFLSTPHTDEAVEFLDPLVSAFKIGSGDLSNIPFLEKVAKKGKPVILGTGMSNLDEVREALFAIKRSDNEKVILLHCTSNYPCPLDEVNLNAMSVMEKELDCLTGYSDHTVGLTVPLMAASMGAVIIEKHFTLNKKLPGPDHIASLEPKELKQMVRSIREIEEALGDGIKKPTESEEKIMRLVRKSIVAKTDLAKGTEITEEMLTVKRPGDGISPAQLNEIVGMRLKTPVKKDTKIRFSDLER